jgi:1-acyl-sn-glycerol-3-phosphate acyltransferase
LQVENVKPERMSGKKKRLNNILELAVKLYDDDYYEKTKHHLDKSRLKTIRKEIGDIADTKNKNVIGLTRFLRPLVLPTANRITLESHFDFSKLITGKNIVVYMPNHKSHLDEFMIGYMLLVKNLPLPIIAAGENLFKTKLTGYLMKSYGAFKIRRDKYSEDEHYYRLLSSYLGACIMAGEQIMSFQEGTRPRDGKIGLFRKGLIGTIESMFNKVREKGDTEIEDITFVPIAINWSENPDEKKLTADVNSRAENTDLIKRFLNLEKTHSSKDIKGVFLGFGEPVSYVRFAAENQPDKNGSYAIGICNEVRSRVIKMMPVFKKHLFYNAIQYLGQYSKVVNIEEAKNLMEVTERNIAQSHKHIKIIETKDYSVDGQIELMVKRGVIKLNESHTGFEILNRNLVSYYANHVTSLLEESETKD